jgi:hypothetical protein
LENEQYGHSSQDDANYELRVHLNSPEFKAILPLLDDVIRGNVAHANVHPYPFGGCPKASFLHGASVCMGCRENQLMASMVAADLMSW